MAFQQLTIYPAKILRLSPSILALLFLIPTTLTGHLWPFGTHGVFILTAFTSFLLVWAVHLNTTRVMYTGSTVELYYLWTWRRGCVQIDTLKRVEQYTRTIVQTPFTYTQLEDENGGIVRFVSDNFSTRDMARFAAAIQQAVAASPEGARKDFVVLNYMQNKYRF